MSDLNTTVLTPEPSTPKPQKTGTVGLVLAIVAAVTSVIPGLNFITWMLAIPALILGVMSLVKKNSPKGKALATVITAGVAWLISIIMVVAVAAIGLASNPDTQAGFEEGFDSTYESPEPTEEIEVEEPVAEETPEPAPEPAAPYGLPYPATQAAVVQIIQDTVAELDSASTELQRSAAITNRDAAICAATGGTMENWVGEIIEIGANGDGFAHIRVEIADNTVVQTWNNAFSDYSDDTLIQPGPVFDALLPLEESTLITFSGQFVGEDGSCVKGSNLTETFYGLDPNFIAQFTAVAAQ